MKTFLVINPNSANGQTGKRWAQLRERARLVLGAFEDAFTRAPMDAARLTGEALRAGYRRIIAVGGDGTINEVVNGFFAEGKPLAQDAALGVIPRGTGGDFRRTFGWTTRFQDALERIQHAGPRPIDVGWVECAGPAGTLRRYFINICSFGASGVVVDEVNRSSKALGGRLTFMLGSLKGLLKYQDRTVRLSVDGGPAQQSPVTTVAVANGRYFGGGMCVAPRADPADGQFDITIWSGYSLADFIFKSRAIYSGQHVAFPGTRTLRGKSVAVESAQEVLVEVDGELVGRLPCRIELVPGALKLCG